MKKTRLCAIITMILCFIAALSFAACSPSETKHIISFDSNGGSSVDSFEIEGRGDVTLPTPEYKGKLFVGWYFDESLTEAVTDVALKYLDLSDDITLYAKWEDYDLTRDGEYSIDYTLNVTDYVQTDDAPEEFEREFEKDFDEAKITIADGQKYLDFVLYGSQNFSFFQGGLKYNITYGKDSKGNPAKLSYNYSGARINSMNMADLDGRRQYRLPIEDGATNVTIGVTELRPGEGMLNITCATYNVTIDFTNIAYGNYAVTDSTLENGIYLFSVLSS